MNSPKKQARAATARVATSKRGDYPGVVRIIGGAWRGRRLQVPDVAGLRPTPDRVRETVFNWLRPWISGARCIDLFAGTGALCLEALSQGAARVVMVEKRAAIAANLRHSVATLGAESAEVIEVDAIEYLAGPVEEFDIVFVDPPFQSDLIARSSQMIEQHGWLISGGFAYIEAPREMANLPIPDSWELVRSQQAGNVGYYLARRR
ncbi:MAG: 16S rRNA (guanine(966)-N(2))-methyltransferase RsmD [Acidiferrobacterales bacterium]